MEVKLLLTSKEVLEKQFRGVPRGYDPLEVDEFLDKVLSDYHKVEENALLDKKDILSMKEQIDTLKKEKQQLEIELGKLKSRFSNIRDTDIVNSSNMELIKKINKYEKFLFNHGFQPDTIK